MTKQQTTPCGPKNMMIQTTPKKPRIGGAMIAGFATLGLFFGLIGTWSVLAPLSSAVVAEGVVKVAGSRKTIQHLEGGIIRELQVKNGDLVKAGEILVRLEDVQSRAAWELFRAQRFALMAQEARLIAERDRAERISFPQELLDHRDSTRVQKMLVGQVMIFASRRRRFAGQVEILGQQIDLLEAEIRGYGAQEKAAINQLALLREEIVPLEPLVAKKIVAKPTLLQLKRQVAHFEGVHGQQRGLIARSERLIGETKLKIIDLQNKRLAEIVVELHDVQTQLSQVRERLEAARDVLDRREIVSPIDGTVVDLRYFTPGGVIAPGDAVMDIVPHEDDLVVETRINPIDVDAIQVGLPAEVRFTAFKQRTTPTLSGEVIYVSADILSDPELEESYFLARVEISVEELARLGGLAILPGMPAQVMIISEERTVLEYLVDPIHQSLELAFREQ